MSRRGLARSRFSGSPPPQVTPATIFPSGNLLWLDGYGGTYLRDAGGAVPDDAESIATYVDRGNVGNGSGAAGTTYSASAFGGRGGIALDGASGSVLVSPAWVANTRISGGAVWRFNGANQALYQHLGLNGHTNVFFDGQLKFRRLAGGAPGDLIFTATAGISRRSVWRMTTAADSNAINAIDSEAGSGSVSGAATVPGTSGATTIGGLTSTIYRLTGLIGELVLHDSFCTADQLSQLSAYLLARWGV